MSLDSRSRKTIWTAAVLACLSFGFFVWRIAIPSNYSFDELQYINSSRALLAHEANPNPEAPPLGKLFIAGGIKLFGDNPWGWRVPSAMFGALALAGFFLWINLLTDSYPIALTAALLTLLNNFLYVFSRTAMMDIYLVAFLIWGLLACTAAVMQDAIRLWQRRALFLVGGLCFGLSCAAKWNGVDALGIVLLACSILLLLPASRLPSGIQKAATCIREIGVPWLAAALLLAPFIAYAATFVPLMHSTGQAFTFHEFASMNAYIWRFHRAVPGNPPITEPWYEWPFHTGPTRDLSYLVGNWYIMFAGLLAVLLCARRFGRAIPETLIVTLYAGFLLQWGLTPQSCLYYYYYFPSALFLGAAIPIALRQFRTRINLNAMAVLPAVVVFLFCLQRMAHFTPPFDCALGCWP
jgi:dolichyl-phosphate-mannose--protein O-mannosyl transferase